MCTRTFSINFFDLKDISYTSLFALFFWFILVIFWGLGNPLVPLLFLMGRDRDLRCKAGRSIASSFLLTCDSWRTLKRHLAQEGLMTMSIDLVHLDDNACGLLAFLAPYKKWRHHLDCMIDSGLVSLERLISGTEGSPYWLSTELYCFFFHLLFLHILRRYGWLYICITNGSCCYCSC